MLSVALFVARGNKAQEAVAVPILGAWAFEAGARVLFLTSITCAGSTMPTLSEILEVRSDIPAAA